MKAKVILAMAVLLVAVSHAQGDVDLSWVKQNLGDHYALAVYSGNTYLYDMPLVEGPLCRLLNETSTGYDLSFEDNRPSGGDYSFHNPDLHIEYLGNDEVTVSVVGGAGGYHWSLVDTPARTVLLWDILKAGASLGDSVTVPVPEPATLSVLALGGLAIIRRRRKEPAATRNEN